MMLRLALGVEADRFLMNAVFPQRRRGAVLLKPAYHKDCFVGQSYCKLNVEGVRYLVSV